VCLRLTLHLLSQLAYNHDWKLYWTLYKHLGCNRIAAESGGGFGAEQAYDGGAFLKRGALLSSNKSIHLNLLGHCWCLRSEGGHLIPVRGYRCESLCLSVCICLAPFVLLHPPSHSPITTQLIVSFFIQMSFRLSALQSRFSPVKTVISFNNQLNQPINPKRWT